MNTSASIDHDVVHALVGSKDVRYGRRPSEDNWRHLREGVGRCLREERPIRILTMWGATKGYGKFPIRGADLLDLMALKRFAATHGAVEGLGHAQGIAVTLIWEDTTEQILTGSKCSHYYESMTDLIHDAGLDGLVAIVRESDLVEDPSAFRKMAAQNADVLFDGDPSTIGWQGKIDWDYYLQRCKSEYPDKSDEEKRWEAARYLGLALARYRCVRMPRAEVKVSFAPYPPTTPDGMRRGRVEWKVKPGKNSHKTAVPWVNFGVVRDNLGWSHASPCQVRSGQFTVRYVNVDGICLPALKEVKP